MQLLSMVYSILYINEPYVSANYIRFISISIMFSHNFCIFMYIVAYIIEFDM